MLTRALERIIDQQPRRPEGLVDPIDLRRADALIELARTRLAQDTDTDRATVVVHVDACVLEGADGVGDIEGSGLLGAEAIRRLACDARLQLVIHGADGLPVGIGRTSRNVPAWLARQLRHRDRGCRWPGCGAKHLLRAHHIDFWGLGGPTDLSNLTLLCPYHHRLVHEGGWTIRGDPNREIQFMRPDGIPPLPTGPPPLRAELRERLLPDSAC